MCRQPLPPPLSSPSAKLMIIALEEYGYQIRRGIRVPKKWRSSYSRDVIFFKKVMKVLEMNEEGLRCFIWMIFVKMFNDIMVNWIESYELMIDLQSIRDPESINF
ncbi:hypothetical protein Tco_0880069 [Tanacetum coccineum]